MTVLNFELGVGGDYESVDDFFADFGVNIPLEPEEGSIINLSVLEEVILSVTYDYLPLIKYTINIFSSEAYVVRDLNIYLSANNTDTVGLFVFTDIRILGSYSNKIYAGVDLSLHFYRSCNQRGKLYYLENSLASKGLVYTDSAAKGFYCYQNVALKAIYVRSLVCGTVYCYSNSLTVELFDCTFYGAFRTTSFDLPLSKIVNSILTPPWPSSGQSYLFITDSSSLPFTDLSDKVFYNSFVSIDNEELFFGTNLTYDDVFGDYSGMLLLEEAVIIKGTNVHQNIAVPERTSPVYGFNKQRTAIPTDQVFQITPLKDEKIVTSGCFDLQVDNPTVSSVTFNTGEGGYGIRVNTTDDDTNIYRLYTDDDTLLGAAQGNKLIPVNIVDDIYIKINNDLPMYTRYPETGTFLPDVAEYQSSMNYMNLSSYDTAGNVNYKVYDPGTTTTIDGVTYDLGGTVLIQAIFASGSAVVEENMIEMDETHKIDSTSIKIYCSGDDTSGSETAGTVIELMTNEGQTSSIRFDGKAGSSIANQCVINEDFGLGNISSMQLKFTLTPPATAFPLITISLFKITYKVINTGLIAPIAPTISHALADEYGVRVSWIEPDVEGFKFVEIQFNINSSGWQAFQTNAELGDGEPMMFTKKYEGDVEAPASRFENHINLLGYIEVGDIIQARLCTHDMDKEVSEWVYTEEVTVKPHGDTDIPEISLENTTVTLISNKETNYTVLLVRETSSTRWLSFNIGIGDQSIDVSNFLPPGVYFVRGAEYLDQGGLSGELSVTVEGNTVAEPYASYPWWIYSSIVSHIQSIITEDYLHMEGVLVPNVDVTSIELCVDGPTLAYSGDEVKFTVAVSMLIRTSSTESIRKLQDMKGEALSALTNIIEVYRYGSDIVDDHSKVGCLYRQGSVRGDRPETVDVSDFGTVDGSTDIKQAGVSCVYEMSIIKE